MTEPKQQCILETDTYNYKIELDEFILQYFKPNLVYEEVLQESVNEVNAKQLDELNKTRQLSGRFFRYLNFAEDGETKIYFEDSIYDDYVNRLFKEDEKLSDYHYLQNIYLLHIHDYWHNFLEKSFHEQSYTDFERTLSELDELKLLIDKYENLNNVEVYIRKKDKNQNVIASDTQKMSGTELTDLLTPYIKLKVYKFVKKLGVENCLKDELLEEFKSYNLPEEESDTFDYLELKNQISLLTLEDKKIDFTSEYFTELYDIMASIINKSGKIDPQYEFLKIVVPQLNKYIEDNAKPRFKKKDKHMLIFNLVRGFAIIPNRRGLDLVNGNVHVKEDFIKQLTR